MLLNDCKSIINKAINNDLLNSKLNNLFDYFNSIEEIDVNKEENKYTISQNDIKLVLDINKDGIKAIIDVHNKERLIKELMAYKESSDTIIIFNTSKSYIDGEFTTNEVNSKKVTYDENDIAVLSEYKRYLAGSLEGNPDLDDLLEVPRAAFDLGFWQDKYEIYKRIKRMYYDTALLTIDGNHRKIFNGVVPLSNVNYQELGIDVYIYKSLDSIEIDPWYDDEMYAIIDRYEGKVKEGLMEYSKGRSKFSYRSNEDSNYYYDKEIDVDLIKE